MCTLEKKGEVFILTLTGPGEHRLNPTLLDAIQSALNQVRAAATSSSVALITTAHGKFFSNGYDLDWAGSDKVRGELMTSKLRSIVADYISLPLPTIAAVTGHACAAGFILARCHDYVVMRKDRGFIYMSEMDIALVIPAWFHALVKNKVGSATAVRDLMLRADKVKAAVAVEKGIIDLAVDGAEETVEAAVRMGEEFARRKWKGHVYAQIRMGLMVEVLEEIRKVHTSIGSRL
ncbi:enoyl-CoA delta isomerase 1, peroxisomal [Argentina anserina]|uniref:enoyl-CoA delta isomerase 1, peroxisomal n=1 Tax=Argentina anserina TaxID=57926 RepID=UPI002176651B|nr:enoyl-CoA delta isomerase 1, peroxisomal [Potentilla anserina]